MNVEPKQWAVELMEAALAVFSQNTTEDGALVIQRAFEDQTRELREALIELRKWQAPSGQDPEIDAALARADRALKETPMLSEAMKAEGWIEHDGGLCPVPLDSVVTILTPLQARLPEQYPLVQTWAKREHWPWDGTLPQFLCIIAYKPEATHD